jgi:S1-C subfamily serine protease
MKCTLLMTTIVAAFLSLNVAACAATPRQLQAAAVYIKVEGIGKDNKPQSWSGSGVCILSGGWVITNEHVAPGTSGTANTIRVFFNPSTPDEFSSAAEVVATHPDRDLALLKCRVNHEPATLRLGRTEQIELTDAVQVVGFPFGDRVSEDRANPSVTIVGGTVSALRKGEGGRLHCIDVAAPVAGGNSGSALVDREGLLIGIITQKYEGFARAIPVEYVQELLGQAAFDVALEPGVAPDAGGEIRVIAKPQGPAAKLILGECRVENGDS